jgi:hypothetical protein
VRFAEEPAVLRRRWAALAARHDVVDLQTHLRSTDAAVVSGPLALSSIAGTHLPLHLGRHGGLPLLLLLDEQFQRHGENLLVGRPGLDVGLPRLCPLQQRHELW